MSKLKDFSRAAFRAGSAPYFAIASREENAVTRMHPHGVGFGMAKSVPLALTGVPADAQEPSRPLPDAPKGTLMLHHVEIYVSNVEVSFPFWSALLAQIGYKESGQWDDGFTLANERDAYLTFVQVAERHAFRQYHRCGVGLNHLAFKVKGRDAVDGLRQYCLENGITSLYDEKYPFANGGTDYYALYVEDPDRIKIEFVAD